MTTMEEALAAQAAAGAAALAAARQVAEAELAIIGPLANMLNNPLDFTLGAISDAIVAARSNLGQGVVFDQLGNVMVTLNGAPRVVNNRLLEIEAILAPPPEPETPAAAEAPTS